MTIEMARPGSYRPPLAGRYRPVGPMRKAAAQSMRKLSKDIETRHPDMGAHQHIKDAADALERNQPEGAVRHLNAAIGNMTPQSLRRHGLLTDEHHDAAKRSMDAIHRHLLLVKDVQDVQEHNDQLPRQNAEGDQADDGLDEKPTADDPSSKAMNVQVKISAGRHDPNVAKPQQVTSPAKVHQIAATNSGDLTTAIELSLLHHFNPLEQRDSHGKWMTGGALASHMDSQFLDKYGQLKKARGDNADPGEYNWKHQAIYNDITSAARAGRMHQASVTARAFADHGGNGWGATRDDAPKMREYADALDKLPSDDPSYTAVLESNLDKQDLEAGGTRSHADLADALDLRSAGLANSTDKRVKEAAGHVGNAATVLRNGNTEAAEQSLNKARRALRSQERAAVYGAENEFSGRKDISALLDAYSAAISSSRPGPEAALPAAARPFAALLSNVELSAKTPALASIPHPFGKPGGPACGTRRAWSCRRISRTSRTRCCARAGPRICPAPSPSPARAPRSGRRASTRKSRLRLRRPTPTGGPSRPARTLTRTRDLWTSPGTATATTSRVPPTSTATGTSCSRAHPPRRGRRRARTTRGPRRPPTPSPGRALTTHRGRTRSPTWSSG